MVELSARSVKRSPSPQARRKPSAGRLRTLRGRVEEIREARRVATAKRVEAERRRQAEEAERARRARIKAVRQRGESVWGEIETEIERRNPSGYDRAAGLIFDLRALAEEMVRRRSSRNGPIHLPPACTQVEFPPKTGETCPRRPEVTVGPALGPAPKPLSLQRRRRQGAPLFQRTRKRGQSIFRESSFGTCHRGTERPRSQQPPNRLNCPINVWKVLRTPIHSPTVHCFASGRDSQDSQHRSYKKKTLDLYLHAAKSDGYPGICLCLLLRSLLPSFLLVFLKTVPFFACDV